MSKYRKHLKRLLYILVFAISLFGSFEYFLPIINNPLKLISNVLFNVINLYLFTPLVSLQENLPISLEIAIWLAPLCTVLGIFSILEKIFVSTKHNLRHKNKKHHLVIGLNNFSYRFINNVLNDDDFISQILLLTNQENDEVDTLKQLGVWVKKIDFTNIDRNKELVAMIKKDLIEDIYSFENEPENYVHAQYIHSIFESCQKEQSEKPDEKKKNFFFVSDSIALEQLLDDQLKKSLEEYFSIQFCDINNLLTLDLLNNSDVFDDNSFCFYRTRELAKSWGENTLESRVNLSENIGSINLLLMGFSKISEKILYNACILGTINLDRKMKVTIVDKNIESKFDIFKASCHEIDKVADIDLLDYPLVSNKLYKELIDSVEKDPFTVCIFASDDFRDSILSYESIVRVLNNSECLQNCAMYCQDFEEKNPITATLKDSMHFFGKMDSVLNIKRVTQQEEYNEAKKFFGEYQESLAAINHSESAKDLDKAWRKNSNYKKQSTLYQYLHQNVKTMLARKCIESSSSEEMRDTQDNLKKELKKATDYNMVRDQIKAVERSVITDYFCGLEHKRWNNFEYMNNFIFKEELYVTKDGKWKPTSSDETLKLHTCLIDDWEVLKKLKAETVIYDCIPFLDIDIIED